MRAPSSGWLVVFWPRLVVLVGVGVSSQERLVWKGEVGRGVGWAVGRRVCQLGVVVRWAMAVVRVCGSGLVWWRVGMRVAVWLGGRQSVVRVVRVVSGPSSR